jgi:hypothetical protein
LLKFSKPKTGCRGRDRMIVEITTTYAISAYHQLRVDTNFLILRLFRAELNIYITACTQCSKRRQMGENYAIAKCLQVEIKRKAKNATLSEQFQNPILKMIM